MSQGPSTHGEGADPVVRATVTEAVIDPSAVLADVEHPSHGAALLFLGVVRDHNDGRSVRGIHYEAYREMAEAELRRIALDCLREASVARDPSAARDPDDLPPGARVSLVHRVGELSVGEVSLAVAVSTAHRADGYELSRALLEELKRRLPVWKKERYVDGAAEWLDGHPPEAGRVDLEPTLRVADSPADENPVQAPPA